MPRHPRAERQNGAPLPAGRNPDAGGLLMKTSVLRRLALLWKPSCCAAVCWLLPAAAAEVDALRRERRHGLYPQLHRDRGSEGGRHGGYYHDDDWQVIDGDATDYLSWVKIGPCQFQRGQADPADRYDFRLAVFQRRRQLCQGRVQPPLLCPDVAASNGGGAAYILCSAYIRATCSHEMTTVRQTLTLRQAGFDDLSVRGYAGALAQLRRFCGG